MPKTAKRISAQQAKPRLVRGDVSREPTLGRRPADRRKAPGLGGPAQLTEDEADVIISERREEDEEWIPWEKVEAELRKE